MAKVEGLSSLVAKLQALITKSKKEDDVSVSVGFTQNYALPVHENLQAKHPVGSAKFLEQPAREMSNDGTFSGIFTAAKKAGKTTAQALLLCGLRLQRESQLLCPIDTGALRASAFTKIDEANQ